MRKTSCIALLLVLVSTSVNAAVILDGNIKRIQENACITIDFLEKYEPNFFPQRKPEVLSVSFHTAEEMAEVHIILYGCDIFSEESKLNPGNEYQDGTVFMIWASMGRNANGHIRTMFDALNPNKVSRLRTSFDERVYSTLEEALDSPEMARLVKKYGSEKVYVQGFSLSGEDKGLFALDQSLVMEVPQ